jgi:thiol-disulfide isomerase/thioredoxin
MTLPGLVLGLAAPLAAAQNATADARAALLPFGSVAPDIAGPMLNGPAGTRLHGLRGKVVAVDFWATWCTPCLQSMPELDQMRQEMIRLGWGDRFEILGVNVDGDPGKARRFLEINPVQYPIVGDAVGIAMKRYGPWKLPATFLLTPEGKVHMIWLGYADNFTDDIQKMALELLRDSGPPKPPLAP